MKQLIARIEEDLHRRLIRRARAESRSLNSLVNEVLTEAVRPSGDATSKQHREQLQTRRAKVARPSRVPSRAAISALTKGAGSAVSDALTRERSTR